jgi:predicted  nucleic acid-binding Zn-ribbon protein
MLNSKHIYLFFIVLITQLSFNSCKKKNLDFIIKGTLYDGTYQKGLDQGVISIYKVPAGSGDSIFLNSVTVGSDGKYEFKVERDKTERYLIKIRKNNYFNLDSEILFQDLTSENPNERNYTLKAKAWVKLVFNNLNPQLTDELKFIRQEGKIGCAECCTNQYQYITGPTPQTNYICVNDANTNYSYYYWVTGTTDSGLKTIFTPALDTVELVLNY